MKKIFFVPRQRDLKQNRYGIITVGVTLARSSASI